LLNDDDDDDADAEGGEKKKSDDDGSDDSSSDDDNDDSSKEESSDEYNPKEDYRDMKKGVKKERKEKATKYRSTAGIYISIYTLRNS